jgi:acetyl/propionyl-CoA carboxylase alpha subunit
MYVMRVAGFVLWLGYGFALGSIPLIVFNVLNLLLGGTVLALKLRGVAAQERRTEAERLISAAARDLGISERTLQRTTASVVGMSPLHFIQQVRLDEATFLLRDTSMSANAIAAAVGYRNAGTIEFLLEGHGDQASFYFLEMNTRLQVEHPVTELITGIDLVKAQIEIAAGGYLPWRQRYITQTGHAIECRIYAEDAENDFMPCPGKIEGLRLPEGLGLRNDCGVYEGAEVPIYYDPMIAKLITWGENRVEAILRMRRALREYQIRGIKTNISFHQWILRHPHFMSGKVHTGFIDQEYHSTSKEEVFPHKEIALASAAIAAQVPPRSTTGSILSVASSDSPAISISTSTECLSSEICPVFSSSNGDSTFAIASTAPTRVMTSCTADLNSGCVALSLLFWIRTLSPPGCLKSS